MDLGRELARRLLQDGRKTWRGPRLPGKSRRYYDRSQKFREGEPCRRVIHGVFTSSLSRSCIDPKHPLLPLYPLAGRRQRRPLPLQLRILLPDQPFQLPNSFPLGP